MDIYVPGCRENHGKGTKIEINKAFWTEINKAFWTKATHLARFVD